MTVESDSYGTVAGVAAYTKRLTNPISGTFDINTTPTLTEVESFLNQCSDTLNGWLAASGYVIPVVQVDAVAVLARYAQIGAAGHVELTQRAGGYDASDENLRENKFLDIFKEAREYILSGALAALGAATVGGPPALSGLRVGGGTATGQALRPIFSRTMFGNNPTAERGPKEPGYSGDA